MFQNIELSQEKNVEEEEEVNEKPITLNRETIKKTIRSGQLDN